MPTETAVLTEIAWTPEAWDKYQEMGFHVERVRQYFGDGPANEMHLTLAQCAMRLFSCGPKTRVTKAFDFDGLNVYTPYIAMGIVWFPDRPDAMKRRLARHGLHYTDDEARADWPVTGEWSLHS